MSLSTVKPDRDDLIAQLQSELSNVTDPDNPSVRPTWNSLLQTATGQKLINYFGTVGSYSQYSIQSAYEESGMESAKLDSSIRGITRTLGVRLARKIPAYIDVVVVRTDNWNAVSLSIQRMQTFPAGSAKLFNRAPVFFAVGERAKVVRLYRGDVYTVTFQGDGSNFQKFTSTEDNFAISDGETTDLLSGDVYRDVMCVVNSTPIRVTSDGLWHYPNNIWSPTVQDFTLRSGELRVAFGNSVFGYVPLPGDTVQIVYAVTTGSQGNQPDFSDTITIATSPVTVYSASKVPLQDSGAPSGALGSVGDVYLDTDNNTVYFKSGPTTWDVVDVLQSIALSGGADEVAPENYRALAPQAYAANNRAVTIDDHTATAGLAPGIADALVRGQSRTFPHDRRYMNVQTITALKDDPDPDNYLLSPAEFQSFLDTYFTRKAGFNLLPRREDPVPSSPPIHIVAYCEQHVDLNLANLSIKNALIALHKYTYGTLGKTLFRADMTYTAQNSLAGIKHVQLISPTVDIITQARSPVLTATNIPGAALPTGSYNYAVVAEVGVYNGVTLVNEDSPPSNIVPIDNLVGNNVRLRWSAVPGATAYRVYGRAIGPANMGLIATVGADVLEWVDDGTLLPNLGQLLTAVSWYTVIRFPKLDLSNLVIEARYLGGR